MQLHFEPGTEKYVKWAKSMLNKLTHMRVDMRLDKITKAFVPEAGVLVHIVSSVWGDSIRITGGAEDLRAWNPSPTVRSIWATLKAVVKQTEVFTDPDWSKSFKTFASWNGSNVVIKREAVEYTIPDSKRLPDDPHNSFHKNLTAGMNDAGTKIVTLADTPSASRAFQVTTWDEDTVSFSTEDVAFPDGVANEVDFTTDLGSATPYPFSIHEKLIFSPIQSGCPGDTNPPYESPFRWRVFMQRPKGQKVFLHVRYFERGTYSIAFSTSSSQLASVEMLLHEKIWSYDLTTKQWAVEYDLIERAIWHAGWGTILDGTFRSSGFHQASIPDAGYIVAMSDESGNLQTVNIDNRTRNANGIFTYNALNGAMCVGGGTLAGTFGVEATLGYTYNPVAVVNLNDQLWISNVAFDTTFQSSGGKITTIFASSTRLGALKVEDPAGDGRRGIIWKHTNGEMNIDPLEAGIRISRSGQWMYRGDLLVYKNGVEVFDLTDVTRPEDIAATHTHIPSAKRDGVVTATWTEEPPEVPPSTVVVSGGTVLIEGFGELVYPDGPPPTGGIAPDGSGLWSLEGDTLVFYTEAELEALFGGANVTITPNGVLYELPVPPPPVVPITHFAAVTFTPNSEGVYTLVKKYDIPREFNALTFNTGRIVPNEFVV